MACRVAVFIVLALLGTGCGSSASDSGDRASRSSDGTGDSGRLAPAKPAADGVRFVAPLKSPRSRWPRPEPRAADGLDISPDGRSAKFRLEWTRSANRLVFPELAVVAQFPDLEDLQLNDGSNFTLTDAMLEHVASLRKLKKLGIHGRRLTDAGLERLGTVAPQIEELNLTNSRGITGKGLGRFQALRRLNAAQTAVDDEGLLIVGSLPHLSDLALRQTRVMGPGLRHLEAVSTLTKFDYSEVQVGNEVLEHLWRLKQLKHLDLHSTRIVGAAIDEQASLPVLESLNLSYASVTDEGIARLAASLPALETLDLSHTLVADQGIVHLEVLPHLKRLNLAATGVSDVGMEHLRKLRSLEDLDLSQTKISLKGLAHLEGLKGLERIVLPRIRLDQDMLRIVASLPELRDLNLSAHEEVGDAEVAILIKAKKLERLDLTRSPIGNSGIECLKDLTKLRELWLDTTKVTDDGLAVLTRLPNLGLLYVSGLRITDAGLERLATLKKLQVLSLEGTDVTDEGLASLRELTDLRLLYLGTTKITDNGIAQLAALKSLEFLDVSGTKVTDTALEKLWEQIPGVVIVSARKGAVPARKGQSLGRLHRW
jgi:internalin A